jgi:hypothetical protein
MFILARCLVLARMRIPAASRARGVFIGGRELTEPDRGDGACGKTSLLNVFTRGYATFNAEDQETMY